MATATYGGDEVSALVLDVGSTWTKAGWAGEDTPDLYMPSSIGYIPPPPSDAMAVDGEPAPKVAASSDGQWFVSEGESTLWRPNMEMRNPLTEGVVSDWDAYEQIWEYTFRKHLRVNPEEHPLLVAEPAWNPSEARQRAVELAFETFDFPAFFMAKTPVLSSFAAGKGGALVIECGGGMTSVTPVHDGYILKKGVVQQPLAGDHLSHQALLTFAFNKINIQPQYMIGKKLAVAPAQPAQVILRDRPNTTPSFHRLALTRTFHDFKETVCAVSTTTFREHDFRATSKPYEFPCGYNNVFSVERYRLPEVLFQPKSLFIPPALLGDDSPHATLPVPRDPMLSLTQMIDQAVRAVDVDLRPGLLSNVIVTGGTAQIPGFAERVQNELAGLFPGAKIKVYSPSSMPEKKFGAWLGGSILASLGTFHQLWISKKEYEEVGKSIIDKKCV
ncbi:hypothetical protein AMAG_12842 [Allomyces macrogynus ATCC 38327]|uniref:Uncharacterized protein n=1 Tax=Allomyces macrogynus (strain ATCC 38327) TaxID=578462 RepID=A0A0L0T1H2_ALLM3|nr:hypothetical protein AMAG_12842 [Allomyces macrogynus ATCC 38327]|eukprot:KNE68673.1 hypothetical protein AMAG_12842 [Allomyces macrogynus ATCC 38327]